MAPQRDNLFNAPLLPHVISLSDLVPYQRSGEPRTDRQRRSLLEAGIPIGVPPQNMRRLGQELGLLPQAGQERDAMSMADRIALMPSGYADFESDPSHILGPVVRNLSSVDPQQQVDVSPAPQEAPQEKLPITQPAPVVPGISPEDQQTNRLRADAMRVLNDPRVVVGGMPQWRGGPETREMEQLEAQRAALRDPSDNRGFLQTLGESLLGQFSVGSPFAVQNRREAKRQQALAIKTKRYDELKAREDQRKSEFRQRYLDETKKAAALAAVEKEIREDTYKADVLRSNVESREADRAIRQDQLDLNREIQQSTEDFRTATLELQREKQSLMNTQYGVFDTKTKTYLQPEQMGEMGGTHGDITDPNQFWSEGVPRTLYGLIENPANHVTGPTALVGEALQKLPYVGGAKGIFGEGKIAQHQAFARNLSHRIISVMRRNPRHVEGERKDLEEKFNFEGKFVDNDRAYLGRLDEAKLYLEHEHVELGKLLLDPTLTRSDRAKLQNLLAEIETTLGLIGSRGDFRKYQTTGQTTGPATGPATGPPPETISFDADGNVIVGTGPR